MDGRISIKSLLVRPEISTLIMFIVIMIGFYLANERFLSARNIRIVMGITPEYIIVAIGIAILMISGEFDLSVGSVFALVPMSIVQLTHQGFPPWIGIAIGLLIGIIIGFVNGFITIRFGIPSFIATLGMLYIARSLTTVATGGFPPSFPHILPNELFVFQFELFRASLYWALFVALLAFIILHRSNLGNWIYATGGDNNAASSMGIKTNKVKMFCFILCGFLAGFAGMIQTFRLEAPLPTQGYLLELESIAAAVIGGVSLFGGIGTVVGAILGAILIRFLESGIIMARIDAEWFRAGLGSLIIISVVLNTYISRRATIMGQNESEE
ncbi:MAG: ABC transporter permease [SAR324 cluster bacterium]|jgi:simple sugar transport system permease protein|nr:ABC transporter permease [SAR324 cluster bacterium]MDP7500466.1 ABC transporter permease [SAR324 cluster bacterium]|tara:strand:+ start:1950 stop:2930 length:981 start_codon:yes stop_codon:yes gene_type:complete